MGLHGLCISAWWDWPGSLAVKSLCYRLLEQWLGICSSPDKDWGFPGVASGKELACQCRRCQKHRFLPWVGKVPCMAIQSSILAWKIPRTEEPGRLLSMGTQRIGLDWSDLAHTHTDWWFSFPLAASLTTCFFLKDILFRTTFPATLCQIIALRKPPAQPCTRTRSQARNSCDTKRALHST